MFFLAPEVLKEEPYTEKSETYAFGVIMWELIARKHPYSEYRWMWELENAVIQGKRPLIPSDCPDSWRKLMEACWAPDPAIRPPFARIYAALKDMQPAILAYEKELMSKAVQK